MKGRMLWISLAFLLLPACLLAGEQPPEALSEIDSTTAGTSRREILIGERTREYLLHLPSCAPDPEGYPVVFFYHGGGGTARSAVQQTGWVNQAEDACFLAVFPEGLPRDPSRRSSFLNNPQTWNDGSGRFNANGDDLLFTEMVLDTLAVQLPVDQTRIYASGFSNGASMAFRVGIDLEEKFAAVAPVAGALWLEDVKLDQPVSLIYLTGTADSFNPLEGGPPRLAFRRRPRKGEKAKPPVENHLKSWADALACDPTPVERSALPEFKVIDYTNCNQQAGLRAYLIEGLGHTWPGGERLLPAFLVGNTSQAVDATAVIWEFFDAHPKLQVGNFILEE